MTRRLPRPLAAIVSKPTWPGTLARPAVPSRLGLDYDTEWARSAPARLGRAVLVDNVTKPAMRLVADPRVSGLEHLEPLDGPVIFAGNHSSHLDTAIVLSSLPVRFRHKTVVAAAADYFFDRRWKAALWAFSLASIPIERNRVNRKSAELLIEPIEQGWSLIIYPEGGRTPDGWGQEFRGYAAYIAKRTSAPVVPFHLKGTRPILPKGASRLRPGKVELRFGEPLLPLPAAEGQRQEDARRFAARLEAAVALLADEAETDWWSARRRAGQAATPPFRGPEAASWRRTWNLPESARNNGERRRLGPPRSW